MTTNITCVATQTETQLKAIGEALAKAYGIKTPEGNRYSGSSIPDWQVALGRNEANAVLRQIAATEGVTLGEVLPTGGMFESPNIQIARNIAAARAVKECAVR